MSVAAGLVYTVLPFLFANFLSTPSKLLIFAAIVLFGAFVVRLGDKIIGGFIVAGFGFLWWYFARAGPYIKFGAFLINLRNGFGIICSAALLLGVAAGAVDIAEAILVE